MVIISLNALIIFFLHLSVYWLEYLNGDNQSNKRNPNLEGVSIGGQQMI